MRFSTNLTIRGGESSLLINRVRYTCSIGFTRGDIAGKQRSLYRRVDDTWHSDNAWHSFRRVAERGDATDNARQVLYQQVLPALADWLRTDDARDLMRQGAAYWRAECQRHADAAERALSTAFQKVQDLRRAVTDGRTLTDDDETFLRHPSIATT